MTMENVQREREIILIYGGWKEQTWSQRNETDEAWGGTLLSWSRTREARDTDAFLFRCVRAQSWAALKGESTGAWLLRWLGRKPKKGVAISCYQERDWRKHLPLPSPMWLEMKHFLLALNVHIVLWNILNGAPVNFVELDEDGSPKTSVTPISDSVSEISLRIF